LEWSHRTHRAANYKYLLNRSLRCISKGEWHNDCEILVKNQAAEVIFTDKEGRRGEAKACLDMNSTGSLDREKVKESICATGNTPFEIASYKDKIPENVFVSYSILKKLRRDALEKLAKSREERIL